MRKVHIISISEPLIIDLALAIREKGYEVTVSGEGLSESLKRLLKECKCKYYGDGWYPEKLTKEINFVVLGATVRKDNPEYVKAKELGLLIQSVPEFIFHRTKNKTRVVVAGAKGKKSIITLIAYALKSQNLRFDYALSEPCDVLSNLVEMSYEARIALIEGDTKVTSGLEKRFQLEFYRPHIAVISNLEKEGTMKKTDPIYKIFQSFVASIEREGKLIFFSGDQTLHQLAGDIREDITAIPFEEHEVVETEGKYLLQTRYGEYPVAVPDNYFLTNLNAARLVCRQLGAKDVDFYQAVSEYSLSMFI